MSVRLALLLAAGLAAAGPASAQTAPGDPRLPQVEAHATAHFASRVVWPAGVRRVPGLLAELERAARSERTSYRGIVESQRAKGDEMTVRFERGAQERFASDRFASLVVETRLDGVSLWSRPITWDIAADRALTWRDLLADSSPEGTGPRAVHAFVTGRVAPSLVRKIGTRAGVRDAVGWIGPRLDALPPFTLVPSREPGRIAGLMLHVGERSGFGVMPGHESFLPAAAILPHLAEPYRALFGGEPVLVDPYARRAADETQRGLSAALLTPDVAPTRVLVVRGEAPSIYFGPEGLDLVLYPDSDEGRTPLRVRAAPEPGLEPTGIAFALRPFTATFRSPKPLDNSCRSESLHVVPGRGSAAEAAGLKPLALPVPIKVACGDFDG